MKPSRLASALLILATATALTACGDGDEATTAGPTTPAPTSAAPSAVATSAATTPTSPAGGAASDKELCEAVKKANDEMRAELVKVATTGDASPAEFRKILTDLETQVTAVASTGDGTLTAALRNFAAEASKAAAAADPAAAADNPAFEKAGKEITTACKAAGVSVIL